MTVAQIRTRVLRRLAEDTSSPVYYTAAEALHAINEGQRLFVLLTLCLEAETTFALNGSVFYSMLATISDYLVPLRLSVGGRTLRPRRLEELDALDHGWQANAELTLYYAHLGLDLLAVSPQETATLSLTYARAAADLVNDGDIPEIPEEDHTALEEYGVYRLRAPEGGAEFTEGIRHFETFLDTAVQRAGYVRDRMRASRYDRGPFELTAERRKKLLEVARAGRKL